MRRKLKYVVGENIRRIRHQRGLTQEQLAEELGLSVRYLAGVERGERNLSLDTLDDLAERLRVQTEALLPSSEK